MSDCRRACLRPLGQDRDSVKHVNGSLKLTILDRFNPTVVEAEVGLIVHALEALHDRFLHLVDDLVALAALGVDPVDSLVVHLDFEVLRPAAIAAKPASDLS